MHPKTKGCLRVVSQLGTGHEPGGGPVDPVDDDRVCGLLALIAGTVSYLHMHLLVELYGQPGWVAALTPLSVDGMIVAASTTLLADSRSGRRGGAHHAAGAHTPAPARPARRRAGCIRRTRRTEGSLSGCKR